MMGVMFVVSVYLVIIFNGIVNMVGEKGKKFLKNVFLFLVMILVVVGFFKGVLGFGNEIEFGLYIGYFVYVFGIVGVFFFVKGFW